METIRFPKVHATEISTGWIETLGFSPVGVHRLYAATAKSA